ncbi:MAG: D-glycero-beta-D-manno-heptose-7-phosphate kinase [Thermovibrio sp.]|nr:MAG: D-glycero-beta-D-manno-heptose-7-phosphate kinase [Thermovibrio sp.]
MFRRELLKKFRNRKVLIIGDFMLDEYIEGKVERISPEAPVPIVEARETTFRPGGAANVAVNVKSLGGSVTILGVVGNDEGGERLRKILNEKGIDTKLLLEDTSRPTTRKTRIISGSQQLLRVDWESKNYISKKLRRELLTYLLENYRNFDVIVISDYGKGVVTKELFEITGEIRRKTPVFLDPKERNFPIYRNVTAMTPNIKETFQAVGIKPISNEDAERAGKKLIEKFNLEYAVVTRSERGISIVTGKEVKHIPTRAKQVFDVTGAGDTVIASFSLAVAAGALPFEAGEIANLAAGIVVGKLGTATVTVEEMEEALNALQNL